MVTAISDLLVILAKSPYILYGKKVLMRSFLKENDVSELLNFSFPALKVMSLKCRNPVSDCPVGCEHTETFQSIPFLKCSLLGPG